MSMVVDIHNAVNERAWTKLMEWEALRAEPGVVPKLVRFMGRPTDVSPKARCLGLIGYKAPFDRHDWIVDRCVAAAAAVLLLLRRCCPSSLPSSTLSLRNAAARVCTRLSVVVLTGAARRFGT